MPHPTPRNDGIWKDAEALIERVEVAARGKADPASFFDDLVEGLRLTTRAGAVTLSVMQADDLILLARSGVLLHAAESDDSGQQNADIPTDDVSNDFASQCQWSDGEFGSRLKARQRLQLSLIHI